MTKHTCPECKSDDWDYPNIGLPGSIQCLDCGYIYPEILSMFPTLKRVETTKKDSIWPFPSKLIPFDGSKSKFNPNNVEDSPL